MQRVETDRFAVMARVDVDLLRGPVHMSSLIVALVDLIEDCRSLGCRIPAVCMDLSHFVDALVSPISFPLRQSSTSIGVAVDCGSLDFLITLVVLGGMLVGSGS